MENNENNGVQTPNTQNTQAPEKDYKHEYEKQLMEIEKLKNAISKTNSENAEYKKKELAKMSDDEKRAREYEELVEAKNKMEAEIRTMKLEKELLAEGFTVEESEKLITSNFAVKTIAEIVKAKVELAVKSAKAEGIKDTTPNSPLGNGTAKGTEKSDFAKYQETKQKTNNEVKLR